MVPTPAEPYSSGSGDAFAAATSSLIEFAGNAGFATSANPAVATSDTGSKSFTGSKPGDRYNAGLMTSMLLAVSSSV